MYNKEYPGFLNGLGSNDGGPSPFQSTLFVFNSFGRLFLYQNLSSSKAIVFLYIYSSIIYLLYYALICIVAMRTTLASRGPERACMANHNSCQKLG